MANLMGRGNSIPVMKGATATEKGQSGLVPAPLAGDQDKVLNGSGEWVYNEGSGTPQEYLKRASVNEDKTKLTLTDQDDHTLEFSGGSGGLDMDVSSDVVEFFIK